MKYITHDIISIPQIPPLANKSIVTIQAFVSLRDIYISVVPYDRSEVDKFLKEFSMFCMTCMYYFNLNIKKSIPKVNTLYIVLSLCFSTTHFQ